jgi:glycosyltransferase involved in cell wall biosynthesis
MSDPIRVVMMVDGIGPETGGGERMVIGLAEALQSDRIHVTVCVTRTGTPPGSAKAQLEEAGVRVLALERPGKLGLKGFRPLLRLIREERPDILHSHKFGSNVWGALFGRAYRLPAVIAQEQTWSFEGSPHRVALDFVIGRLADAYVAVSTADRDRMIKRERVPPEKITVIPNAYVPRVDDASGDLRAELGLPPEAKLVGTAAVLRPQKALEVLMEAFGTLAGHPDAHLVIAGEGSRKEPLRQQAAELGVSDRTHFIGRREDVPMLLENFDIAAMSSDYEGTPLFALECMAHGTPLLATDVGGLPDLIDDDVSGVLVPPRDPAAMNRALDRLLSDDELRDRLGAAAAERSAEFRIDRIAPRFERLYESVLERSSR